MFKDGLEFPNLPLFQTQCLCWWRTKQSRASVLPAFVARVTLVQTTITTKTEGDHPRSGSTGNTLYQILGTCRPRDRFLGSNWLHPAPAASHWLQHRCSHNNTFTGAGSAVQDFVILRTHPHRT